MYKQHFYLSFVVVGNVMCALECVDVHVKGEIKRKAHGRIPKVTATNFQSLIYIESKHLSMFCFW